MQGCFREHPDIYGAELEDDEAPEAAPVAAEGEDVTAAAAAAATSSATPDLGSPPPSESTPSSSAVPVGAPDDTARAQAAKEHMEKSHSAEAASESDELVPKAAHDATSANAGK